METPFLPAREVLRLWLFMKQFASLSACYHLFATNLAVEASKEFFKGIREAVGDEKFAKFLNLKSDRSLALVIDVTGSMREEIEDVKRHSKKFVKQAVASGGSFTYILVPFSDPDVGPVTVTSDPDKALKAVSKLQADGGDDCPEKGMTGLYEALLRSTKGSNVYYFSDADAKDAHREKEVLSLAKEKKISITFFITGKCPSRKRRAYQGVFLRTKRKTTATIKGLYERLASATGGQVFTISKKEVRTAIETIGALQTTSSSTAHKRKVLLLSVEENSALQVERVYHVSIDSTVKNILITLTASNIKQLLLTNVSGVSSKTISTHVVSQSNSLLALVARNISSGKVDLNISCFGPYNLQVTSQSQIYFSYQLRRVTKFGDIVPVVSGNIIQGQNLLLSFDLSGRDYIGNISSLSVIDKQANEVNTLSIKEGKGFHKGKYYALFIATVQTFRIKITGLDSNGAEFQRLKTSLINVGTTELKQVLDGYESIAVSPGDSTTLKFILRNKGKTDEFRIKASDDMSYTQDVSPHSVWLEQNASVDINVTLQVNQGALHGTTATVTVSVEANSLEESASSFIVSYVSVAAKNPDLSPPKCVVLSHNSTCSTLEGLNCMSNTWAAHIQFKDLGKGLKSIGLTGNSKGNLSVDAFSRGVSNSPVGAVYESDCCHTEALVVGLDMSGNAGRCFISVATAGDALVTNVSNTKRTLYKDEIIKIPFTVTNYGSPGLYTFEVSKANHIIGLISPFSVFLDSNETTEFQLSLTALEEAVYRRTVVAVKALKRISTANARQRDVQLFDASLLLLSRLKIVMSTSSDQVVVNGVKSVTLAFQIKNLMDKVTFVLKVVTPVPHLIASFRPGLLTLQKNEMSKCSLTLTASNINLKEKVTLKVAAAQQLDSGEVLDPVFLSYLEVILVPEKKYDLSLLAPLPSREAKLQTGETTAINFTVINKGKAASIVFEVSVRGFFVAASVVPSRAKLHPNESLECHLEISSKEETTHVHNASIAVYAISSDYSRKTKSTTTFPLFKVGVLIQPVNRYNVTTWRNDSNRRAGIIAGTVTVILVLVALVIIVFAVKKYKVSHRSLNPRRGRHVKIRMTPENEDDPV